MFKIKKGQKAEVKRITEYLISGGAHFWSGYIAFFILDTALNIDLVWSTTIAYLIGWTINFLLQRFWVFNNPKLAKHRIEVSVRYITLSAVNILINYLILYNLKKIGISPYIGQFVSAGFFTGWNYMWYRLWVFSPKYSSDKS